jgi:hypothetical protein
MCRSDTLCLKLYIQLMFKVNENTCFCYLHASVSCCCNFSLENILSLLYFIYSWRVISLLFVVSSDLQLEEALLVSHT